jgi:hypothetical protein
MQHRKSGFVAVGVAAAGLCAVLATTALASSDHGTAPRAVKQSRAVEKSRTAVKKAVQPKAAPDARTKDQSAEENRLLLRIQTRIKASTAGPTKAQVAEAGRLVGQLKAQGKATPAQLAWLALAPARKSVEAAPVGTN